MVSLRRNLLKSLTLDTDFTRVRFKTSSTLGQSLNESEMSLGAVYDGEGVVLWSINEHKYMYSIKEIRFRFNLRCLDHSTNVFQMINIPFLISVIA